VQLSTTALTEPLTHNTGDFTAELGAGVPLATAQQTFARVGQWLALDPPRAPGDGGTGTIGGLVAAADSGPARHHHGSVRDLIIGITVVLADGTIARAGGNVIKNVAGYDLAKLFTGSRGTLGLITSVTVRLHPRPAATATALATTTDPAALTRAAIAVAGHPLEAACLDVSWRDGTGTLLIRFAGRTAADQARHAHTLLRQQDGLTGIDLVGGDPPGGDPPGSDPPGGDPPDRDRDSADEPLWAAQRAGQRSADGAVLAVAGLPTGLPRVIEAAATAGATVVSRAALGLSWLALPPGDDLPARLATTREALRPWASTVTDGAHLVADPWPPMSPGVAALHRRIKQRFDPAGVLRPGTFAGGI
jgi:glycolate oxidase FAD binding subunit